MPSRALQARRTFSNGRVQHRALHHLRHHTIPDPGLELEHRLQPWRDLGARHHQLVP